MNCKKCGNPLSQWRIKRHALYCSDECKSSDYADKYRKSNPRINRDRNVVGVVSEHRVIVDLLNKGYEIFKAISPASSCDLAVLHGGKLLRVEVTTAHYSPTGKMAYSRHKRDNFDLMAIVLHDKIIYIPELPK